MTAEANSSLHAFLDPFVNFDVTRNLVTDSLRTHHPHNNRNLCEVFPEVDQKGTPEVRTWFFVGARVHILDLGAGSAAEASAVRFLHGGGPDG